MNIRRWTVTCPVAVQRRNCGAVCATPSRRTNGDRRDRLFGLDVAKVQDVLSFRGEVITAVHLRVQLGLSARDFAGRRRWRSWGVRSGR
jgi:hypothetical protein